MKKRIIFILPGLFAIAFISLVLIGNLGPSKACNDKKAFVNSAYKAVVIEKYLDKQNHNFRTIIFSNNHKLYTMVLVDDTSGYYEYSKAGDTIYKYQNSEYIDVNGMKKFKIHFDCK